VYVPLHAQKLDDGLVLALDADDEVSAAGFLLVDLDPSPVTDGGGDLVGPGLERASLLAGLDRNDRRSSLPGAADWNSPGWHSSSLLHGGGFLRCTAAAGFGLRDSLPGRRGWLNLFARTRTGSSGGCGCTLSDTRRPAHHS